MNFTRRGLGGLAAGALAGGQSLLNHPRKISDSAVKLSRLEVASQARELGQDVPVQERRMLMEHNDAMKLIFSKGGYRDQVESECYKAAIEHGYHMVDPDLQHLKAVSPMVKQVYQRQRLVKREMENQGMNKVGIVHKLLAKIMWGEDIV